MNLLHEGIEQKAVSRTPLTRKLTIDGITNIYPVYKIKLDWLFYNDQNDRIATWMSQYRAEHNGQIPEVSDKEAYNAIIEQFIVKSNPEAIKKTQANIELVEQREPGVVLADGRIIDGNRRFTCLRRLSTNNENFKYFEAVILDRNIENSAKQIKMLELSIQHGEEGKVDYNPVDRLAGIYHDIIETKLLDEDEYAKSTNCTIAEVKAQVDLATLMEEFLEFIHVPQQFYIARKLQAAYPLEELLKIMKKCKTDEEKDDLKIAVFHNILLQPAGDMTRFIRNFKLIVGSEYQEDFVEEQKEFAEETLNTLPPQEEITASVILDKICGNEAIKKAVGKSVENTITKVKKTETRNRPVQYVEKATAFIEEIDTNIFQKLTTDEVERLKRQIELLEKAVSDLKTHI